ncbi:hypothetical protein [Marinobacter alkaliphilus]|uniref:Uncharacterized protein n=1 Tax=Marinobacter alkaliphilus TaxID=254719 RepID=A0ABZ3E9E8_9GAMM
MQTATMINHDYQGPTRNPNGEALKRLTHQFRNVTGPEQVRKCLKAWGLAGEISPRQARFWQESTTTEKAVFCDAAGVSIVYRLYQWADIPDEQRARLWRGIVDITQWGERLRGRF